MTTMKVLLQAVGNGILRHRRQHLVGGDAGTSAALFLRRSFQSYVRAPSSSSSSSKQEVTPPSRTVPKTRRRVGVGSAAADAVSTASAVHDATFLAFDPSMPQGGSGGNNNCRGGVSSANQLSSESISSIRANAWDDATGAMTNWNSNCDPNASAHAKAAHAPQSEQPITPTSQQFYPVSAIHIAQTIHLFPVLSTVFARNSIRKQMFGQHSAVVQLVPLPPQSPVPARTTKDELPLTPDGDVPAEQATTQQPPLSITSAYIAIFRFGSVVSVNVPPPQLRAILQEIKRHAIEPALSGSERKEHFGIWVVPPAEAAVDEQEMMTNSNPVASTIDSPSSEELPAMHDPEWLDVAPINTTRIEPTSSSPNSSSTTRSSLPVAMTRVTGDYCVVPELDMNAVAVISNIMAQTVALDTYNDTVDHLLAHFAQINASVTKSGSLTEADKTFLFRTVAQNNAIFIDMISKIRLKDRSDTAWNLTRYEKIHYDMKEEFEIDDRFDHIEFKLNLIQNNAKFFLEVLQHQKTNSLEWIIVVLIAVECALMCIDMSGMGEALFSAVSSTAAESSSAPSLGTNGNVVATSSSAAPITLESAIISNSSNGGSKV